jgi:hypothetical protein
MQQARDWNRRIYEELIWCVKRTKGSCLINLNQ